MHCPQGHPVGMLGEDGGPTAGALSDGVPGMETSEHHNPPEMLDGLDGKNFFLNLSYFIFIFFFNEKKKISISFKILQVEKF